MALIPWCSSWKIKIVVYILKVCRVMFQWLSISYLYYSAFSAYAEVNKALKATLRNFALLNKIHSLRVQIPFPR